MTSVLTMDDLRAGAYAVARAVVLAVIAIWAGRQLCGRLRGAVRLLAVPIVVYLIIWRSRGSSVTLTQVAGASASRSDQTLQRSRVHGSDLALGKRVFVTADPSSRWNSPRRDGFEAIYLILWAPFVFTGPLFAAATLLEQIGREEPQVVAEWSWLPIGGILLAGFYVSLVGCVSWAAHEFVGPGMIGRRLAIPIVGRALCIAYRDVCAVEIGRDADRGDHLRLIRTGTEPMEIRAAARFMGRAQPTVDLLPLAELLARAARVPVR